MQNKSLVFLSSVLLVLLLNIITASATNYCVGPSDSPQPASPSTSNCGSRSQPCPNINALLTLNILKPGDCINLLPGTYTGLGLNIGLVINIPNLQILGDDPSTVIIDLQGSPTFLTITAAGVVVSQVTIKGAITGDVNVGVLNIQLTVLANVNAMLDAIKINNVNFLNIQGTAVLCADVNALDGAVNVQLNANIFVNVVLSLCSFVNVTVDPVIQVVGRISLRLNSVSFNNCGSPDVAGAVVLATKSSAVVLVSVSIENCQGATLLDVNAAATLTVNGVLVLKDNVVSVTLLNLSESLNVNLLGVSVRLDGNTAPVGCTNMKCQISNMGCMCPNCGTTLDVGSFF